MTGDIDGVIDVLAEASSWLRARGITQWPERFAPSDLTGALATGELYVVDAEASLAATVTLLTSDPPFWGQREDAVFVHRLAVRRSSGGMGASILDWASGEARKRRRPNVCLDCLSSNVRLRRYYEDLGFRLVGEIDGPADHPHTAAHGPWRATLYEKHVGQG